MEFAYLIPLIPLLYQQFDISSPIIGVSVGSSGILYAIFCPLAFMLLKKMDKRGIIVIGFILAALSMVGVGGYDMFEGKEGNNSKYAIVLVGTFGISIASALINVPTMPEMLLQFYDDERLRSIYNLSSVENMASGLFVTAQSIGNILGPILSS